MTPFADSLGFAVEEYAAGKGKIPPRSVAACNSGKFNDIPPCRNRRKKLVVYVATIEKANGLVNSLIEHGRLPSLGLVVVDEVVNGVQYKSSVVYWSLHHLQLHMLGDGTVRGATLESCLAKVLYCSSEYADKDIHSMFLLISYS